MKMECSSDVMNPYATALPCSPSSRTKTEDPTVSKIIELMDYNEIYCHFHQSLTDETIKKTSPATSHLTQATAFHVSVAVSSPCLLVELQHIFKSCCCH